MENYKQCDELKVGDYLYYMESPCDVDSLFTPTYNIGKIVIEKISGESFLLGNNIIAFKANASEIYSHNPFRIYYCDYKYLQAITIFKLHDKVAELKESIINIQKNIDNYNISIKLINNYSD
jgi:hypothetical protein